MRILFSLSLAVLLSVLVPAQQSAPSAASSTQAIYNAQAQSCQSKFDRIQENAQKERPDQSPLVLTENEINAWLASDKADLPKGVKRLRFSAETGFIRGTAHVDFDEITAERRSSNPLLSLFRGTHEVVGTAKANGSGGMGRVDIDSVSIDGVPVPRLAMEYFIDKYIKPKHPEIGLNSRFRLPYRIDLAIVGERQLTVTQK